MGYNLGRIFYWTLYDVGDYDYPKVEIDFPIEFDAEGEVDSGWRPH